MKPGRFAGGAALIALCIAAFPAGAECVRTTSIRGYEPLDKENLILRAGSRAYHVEVRGFCFGLQHTNVIAYADGDHDRRLCPGGADAIVVRDPRPESCRIGNITELGESQLSELRARYGRGEATEGVVEETMPSEDADQGAAEDDADEVREPDPER